MFRHFKDETCSFG